MQRKDSKGRILRNGEGQDASGRYYYKYTDNRGTRKTAYSWKLVPTDRVPQGKRNDLSLREKIKTIERDLQDGIDSARAAKMSFNDLYLEYLDTKTKLRVSSREKYRQLWKLHIRDSAFGQMMIPNIKKAHVQKVFALLT